MNSYIIVLLLIIVVILILLYYYYYIWYVTIIILCDTLWHFFNLLFTFLFDNAHLIRQCIFSSYRKFNIVTLCCSGYKIDRKKIHYCCVVYGAICTRYLSISFFQMTAFEIKLNKISKLGVSNNTWNSTYSYIMRVIHALYSINYTFSLCATIFCGEDTIKFYQWKWFSSFRS